MLFDILPFIGAKWTLAKDDWSCFALLEGRVCCVSHNGMRFLNFHSSIYWHLFKKKNHKLRRNIRRVFRYL